MEGLPQPLTIKLNMPDKPRSAPQNAEEPMAFSYQSRGNLKWHDKTATTNACCT